MPNQELAFAKQGLLNTKDWDTFQKLLRLTLKTSHCGLIIR